MKRAWLLALLLPACAEQDAGGADPGDGRPPPDMRGDCGVDQADGGCRPPPMDPCVQVDRVHPPFSCVDADGDCYPERCAAALDEALRDCDDTRAEAYPRARERCNGEDDDCDGQVDEGFGIGAACTVCGTPGKVECHASDPLQAACSVAFGQSSPAERIGPEVCNAFDDDCDDRVDEGCSLLGVEGAPLVRRCGAHVLLLDGGRLVESDLAGQTAEIAGSVAAIACSAAHRAWLQVDAPDAACAAGEDGPWLCTDAGLIVDGEARLRGTLGAPWVAADGIHLTARIDDRLVALRVPLDAGTPVELGDGLSDPRPIEGGLVARRWGAPVEVVRIASGATFTLDAAPEAPGPPVVGDGFAAWITTGGAPVLWLVALPDGAGLQIATARPGAPWLVEGGLFWVDAAGLQRFDLLSGRQDTVIAGALDPQAVDVTPDGIVWVEDGQLRRGPLP